MTSPHFSPHSFVRYLVYVICGFLVLSCSSKDNSDPPALLTDIEDPIPLFVDWSIDTRANPNLASYNLRPLVLGNQIISIDSGGEASAFEAKTGRKKWSFSTGLQAITGFTGNLEKLIASSRDGDLKAYRVVEKGLKEIWSVRINTEIRAIPVIDGDQVFVRSVDGKLSAFSALDGSALWTVSRRVPALSLTGTSHPLVLGNLVFAGFDDGKLMAFNRKNGQTEWESTIAQPRGRTEIERLVDLDSQFVFRDGIIYISSYRGRLAAVQAQNGNILWSREFSSYQSISVDDQALYLSGDNSHIWSIDRRTGSAFWKQDVLHGRKITAPLLLDGKLVVADYAGYVHWFDIADGSLKGRVRASEARHYAQPVAWLDNAVLIDKDGFLSLVTQF